MIYRDLEHLPSSLRGCALTIGNFDGVHRGHQQIVAQAAMLAARSGCPTVALTFDPHPLQIVSPQRAPAPLMPLSERVDCLLEAGCDAVVVARSEPGLLALSAEDFIRKVVAERFAPRYVVEGWSFGFGRGRTGTPQLMKELGQRFSFETYIVDPLKLSIEEAEPSPVSSSLIRRLLADGQVHRAALCLGRPYALHGVVQKGHSRGRSLGFPTANLGGIEQLIPAQGVYAGRARIRSQHYPAAVSIGTVPTFDAADLQAEAYLLDFDGDIYNEPICVDFLHYLRAQQKFPAAEHLRRQIELDVARVRALTE